MHSNYKTAIKALIGLAVVGLIITGILAVRNYDKKVQTTFAYLNVRSNMYAAFLQKYMPDQVKEFDAELQANNTPAK